MGLDMYIRTDKQDELHYWRKHNALHNWFLHEAMKQELELERKRRQDFGKDFSV